MASILGEAFFPPSTTPYAHIINILYVFLIGLLVRPIGNIIMGTFADQIGRKKLMIISLIFTGLGTICIGLLPTYSSIGVWSTILFVMLRVFQNFFAGIEYINSATYLIESSDKNTRGYYASWTAIGISGGYLLASIVALIVTTLISKQLIPSWSWRLVFIFSIFGVAFGLWLRRAIPESLAFILNSANSETNKRRDIIANSLCYIKDNTRQCLSISAITLMGICLTYIYYIYIPINLITSRHFTHIQAYSLNSICLTIVVALIPFFGKISDYLDRITLLKFTCGIVIALAMPFFWLCSYGTYTEIILITALISIPASCFFSLYPAIITESFPSKIRCTTASLIYQVIVSIEMGTLPLMITYLIGITKVQYSPGYLLIVATIIGYIGLIHLRKKSHNTDVTLEDNESSKVASYS
jgi:MHS family proline/betaine transporter-like MFS transporter